MGSEARPISDPWQPIPERGKALDAMNEARSWFYLMDQLDWVAAVFDPVHGFEEEGFNWDYACEVGAHVIERVLSLGGIPE